MDSALLGRLTPDLNHLHSARHMTNEEKKKGKTRGIVIKPVARVVFALQAIGAGYGFDAMGCPFPVNLILAVLIGWAPFIGTGVAVYGAWRSWDLPLGAALAVFAIPLSVLGVLACYSWSTVIADLRKWQRELADNGKSILRGVGFFMMELVSISLCLLFFGGITEEDFPYLWLTATGESAPGMVVSSEQGEDDENRHYSLTVKLKTREGNRVTTMTGGKGFVPSDFSRLEGARHRGSPQPVQLRYSSRNPYFCVIVNGRDSTGWIAFKVTAIFLVIGGICTGLIVNGRRSPKSGWTGS